MAHASEEQRPRLAIVAPSAYRLGGVQSWLDYLVPGLEALGWPVTLLLGHGIHCDSLQYLLQHPFSDVRVVSNPTGSREGRIRALRTAIRDARAELVLCVNIVDVYEAVSRERSAVRQAPKVASALHGLHACFYKDLAQWSGVIDGVIAVNRLAAAAAVKCSGIATERVHYAPCGVDVPTFRQLDSGDGQLALLYAGRFDTVEKRVLDLPAILRALLRRNIEFRLQLAGAGPAEDLLRQALAEFGSRVEFRGELDSETLQESFFRPGAIALVLSPCETGPLVAFEAMARGVAVVTSNYVGSGLEDSLRHGETCVKFETGDVNGAASAIASLIDSRVRRSLARAGYEMVRRRYSRRASITAWDKALRTVWASPRLTHRRRAVEPPVSGRLDRYLGARIAENVRRVIGVSFPHTSPGDEWPHSYGSSLDSGFFNQLVALDRSGNRRSDVGANF